MLKSDVLILRELASKYAEIAALPWQAECRALWFSLNDGPMQRPLVLIDQLPWNELNHDGSLDPCVQHPYWRSIEAELRMALYRWNNFSEDRVFEPYICLPRPIHSTGWGIETSMDTLATHDSNGVLSQRYHCQINDWNDIERIHDPQMTLDSAREAQIISEADEIFDGIIPWKLTGHCLHLGVWDTITFWMGVENCYIELMDRPELMHALMEKLTGGLLEQIRQMNELELFDIHSMLCHCSHTYSKALTENGPARSENAWAFGLAQLFTSVSPAITREFEVEYMKRVFPHFGAVYYGCCDRLDDRLDVIEELPRVQKISCSPWSDRERFAERLNSRYVMSNKPNPAFLVGNTFDEDVVRADIARTVRAARAHGVRLEFILKDVSTVHHDPSRLNKWTKIVREEVCG